MAEAGTLLSDLDGKQSLTGDDDLVQKIFAEMNAPNGGNTIGAPPPALSGRAMAPGLAPVTAMSQLAMDPTPATAHVIGGQHPTPADFAHAMHGLPVNPYLPVASGPPQGFMPQPQPQQSFFDSLKLGIGRELKTPLLVAIIVFVMSLPFVNTMIGMYLPSMLRIGGDLTTMGLALKSLAGGALFWVLHRIVAPLI